MPTIKKTAALAAGADDQNIFAGSAFEFLPFDSSVQFSIVGGSGLLVTVQTGSDVIQEESAINVGTAFGKFPDDFDLSDVAAAGERVKVAVRNPTGGSLNYFITAIVNPV